MQANWRNIKIFSVVSTSSLMAPILTVSGIGAAGVGGVNLFKWQRFESEYPTADSKFYDEGFSWDPIQIPNERREKFVKRYKRIKLQKWGCFNRMFPDLEFTHNDVAADKGSKPTLIDRNIIDRPIEKAVACAIMDLQPVAASKRDQYFYYFRTEMVVKGENSAVALWVGLTNLPANNEEKGTGERFSNSFVYRTLGISKNKDGKWEIEEGYQWNHYSESYDVSSKNKGGFYVKAPGEQKYWLNGVRFKDRGYIPPQKWMGIWETVDEEDDETSGVLEDIQAFRYSGHYAELLGRGNRKEDVSFSNDEKDLAGYSKVNTYYDKAKKGWVKNPSLEPMDISDWLDYWYLPFLQSSGKWTDFNDRCSALFNSRLVNGLEDANIQKIRDLCYSKTK